MNDVLMIGVELPKVFHLVSLCHILIEANVGNWLHIKADSSLISELICLLCTGFIVQLRNVCLPFAPD